MTLSSDELTELYTRYGPIALARARRLLGDEALAWDITHDVFVRLSARRAPTRQPVRYLYRAITHACIDAWRRAEVRRPVELDADLAGADPFAATLARDVLRAVWHELDETDQQIVVLRFVDGLPQSEIAEILGVWRRTVGRRLKRIEGRARALAEEGP